MSTVRDISLAPLGDIFVTATGCRDVIRARHAEIMDPSFALQALSARHLALHGKDIKPGLYDVPEEIDNEVIMLKLRAMGLGLDELTDKQKEYLLGK